jgi:hypothetical protein
MKEYCWSGTQWYCLACGNSLKEFEKQNNQEEEKSILDFESDEEYHKYYDEFHKDDENEKILLECLN